MIVRSASERESFIDGFRCALEILKDHESSDDNTKELCEKYLEYARSMSELLKSLEEADRSAEND